ncbi:putative Cytoplasmic dynein 1 light intermediate chain 2 [Paratrimastix pyriformis]|uniref:Dynein light intermediate chain n=1 Tax=Paratrimastix pyriformis TaxID=342808 RepID=A0ABQ8UMP4_9EUKA|nr:putative Cytoplasmic dynein 1 light intermediate chain 2 [Paratrimastix pyriformis]
MSFLGQLAARMNDFRKRPGAPADSAGSRADPSLLVLGDAYSGKRSLIARFQNKDIEDLQKGLALDFTTIDSEEDDLGHLNIWALSGDGDGTEPLLDLVLQPERLSQTGVLIVLDWSRPWSMLPSLRRFLRILRWRLGVAAQQPAILGARAALAKWLQAHRYQDPLTAEESPAPSPSPLPAGPSDPSQPSALAAAAPEGGATPSPAGELPAMPLHPGTLAGGLGVPIVVALNKADRIGAVEKERRYTDAHFDFIQRHLRMCCLEVGAPLVSVSAKHGSGAALLLQTIRSVLVPGCPAPAQRPQLLERSSLYVPLGWDSLSKMRLLLPPAAPGPSPAGALMAEFEGPGMAGPRTEGGAPQDGTAQGGESPPPPAGPLEGDGDREEAALSSRAKRQLEEWDQLLGSADPAPRLAARPEMPQLAQEDGDFLSRHKPNNNRCATWSPLRPGPRNGGAADDLARVHNPPPGGGILPPIRRPGVVAPSPIRPKSQLEPRILEPQ